MAIETSYTWMGTDEIAAIDALNAIYEYVRSQRPRIAEYPGILPLIESFEGWYQGLEEASKRGIGVLDPGIYRSKITQSEVNEAKRRREEINKILGEHIPDSTIPADAPQTPPDKPPDPPLKQAIDTAVTIAIILGIVYAGIQVAKK